jgi:hypothetical protein
MTQPREKLSSAIDLSNRILELADAQEWAQVEQLDGERMELLKAVFSDPDLDRTDPEIRSQLQQVLQLNDQAVGICSNAREGLVSDGRKLQQGKEAVSAYLKNQ